MVKNHSIRKESNISTLKILERLTNPEFKHYLSKAFSTFVKK